MASSPGATAPIPWNVSTYWRLGSVPADGLRTLAERIRTARQAGPIGALSALLSAVPTVAEMVLLPRDLTHYLKGAGWVKAVCTLERWLEGEAIAAADWLVRGQASHASDEVHVGHSRARGVVVARPGREQREAWVHAPTFRRHAGALWATPLIDLDSTSVRGPSIDGGHVSITAKTPPRAPVSTSNPSPAALATLIRATPSMGQRMRSLMLIGPSGSGKTMTALATARELGSANRTLRVQGTVVPHVEANTLLQLVELLEPTCLLLDDVAEDDTAHLMHLLDQLAGAGKNILVLATVMHEGPIEDARLPGLRPERMDVLVPFHAPNELDREALLRFYGLDEELARQLVADARLESLTGAYLRALAERILAGVAVEDCIRSLVLHHQVAGHNHVAREAIQATMKV